MNECACSFWTVLRTIDFVVTFICFVILLYRGVYKVIAAPELFSWDRLMNLLWSFATCFGLGEVLFQGVDGGIRVIVVTVVAFLQLYVVLFKSPFIDPAIPIPKRYKNG